MTPEEAINNALIHMESKIQQSINDGYGGTRLYFVGYSILKMYEDIFQKRGWKTEYKGLCKDKNKYSLSVIFPFPYFETKETYEKFISDSEYLEAYNKMKNKENND